MKYLHELMDDYYLKKDPVIPGKLCTNIGVTRFQKRRYGTLSFSLAILTATGHAHQAKAPLQKSGQNESTSGGWASTEPLILHEQFLPPNRRRADPHPLLELRQNNYRLAGLIHCVPGYHPWTPNKESEGTILVEKYEKVKISGSVQSYVPE